MKCSYSGCRNTIQDPGAYCNDCHNVYCTYDCKTLDLKQRHGDICVQDLGYELEDFHEVDDIQMRVLGKGNYGEVRLVQHKAGGLFALKVV